jgi:hypothetical protein
MYAYERVSGLSAKEHCFARLQLPGGQPTMTRGTCNLSAPVKPKASVAFHGLRSARIRRYATPINVLIIKHPTRMRHLAEAGNPGDRTQEQSSRLRELGHRGNYYLRLVAAI